MYIVQQSHWTFYPIKGQIIQTISSFWLKMSDIWPCTILSTDIFFKNLYTNKAFQGLASYISWMFKLNQSFLWMVVLLEFCIIIFFIHIYVVIWYYTTDGVALKFFSNTIFY